MAQKNTELVSLKVPPAIKGLVHEERDRGVDMTATYCTAIYWYFNHLGAADREAAREGYRKWLAKQPADDGIEPLLKSAFPGTRSARKSPGSGRRPRAGGTG